ncbi:MAG: hypothetical protein Q8P03_00760 [bacterium]|nr:hypothetical protein [bacterium]
MTLVQEGINIAFARLKTLIERHPGQHLRIDIHEGESGEWAQSYSCTLAPGTFRENTGGCCVFPTSAYWAGASPRLRPGPLSVPRNLVVIAIDPPEKRWPVRDRQKRPLFVDIHIGSKNFQTLLPNYLNAETRQQIAA